jgi:hypothetical protein
LFNAGGLSRGTALIVNLFDPNMNQKNFGSFLQPAQTCKQRNCSSTQAEQITAWSENIIKSCDGARCQKKRNMKTKFFL